MAVLWVFFLCVFFFLSDVPGSFYCLLSAQKTSISHSLGHVCRRQILLLAFLHLRISHFLLIPTQANDSGQTVLSSALELLCCFLLDSGFS